MDFKFRNQDWVGNIYQKFEAICQEMDDIVSKNPVQYVGNQVHNVGENVKKFCSDVIDLLPPPSGPVKTEAKEVPPEGNAANNTHIDSVLATKKVSSDTVTKLSYMEPHVIDSMVNQVDDVSGEHHIVDQLNTPNSVDACKESDSVLSKGKIADVLTNEKSELSNEVNAIEECEYGLLEKTSPIETEPIEVSPLNEFNDNNITNKHVILAELAPETSAYVLESESPQFCDVADHSECYIGSSSAQSEIAFSVVTAAEGDNIGSSSSPSEVTFSGVTSAEGEQESNISSVLTDSINSLSGNSSEILSSKEVFCHNHVDGASCVSDSPCHVLGLAPETSAYVLESESPQFCDVADHSKCDIGSSSAQSEIAFSVVTAAEGDNIGSSSSPSEMTFSVVTAAEEDQGSNISSVLTNSINSLSGNPSEILSSKEVFCHNHVDGASCVSDSPCHVLSSIPASIFSTKNKAVEAQPVSSSSVLSLKSFGEANCRKSEIFSLFESSGGKDIKSCETAPLEACFPFIEIDDYDSVYSSMETIDLCDKVKLDESCVFVDDSALYTISCRVKKLRSYKKRIRDIFASKKRLAKEYEQLAIWYGDCDIDSSSRTPFDTQNLQTHHACDSEWELL